MQRSCAFELEHWFLALVHEAMWQLGHIPKPLSRSLYSWYRRFLDCTVTNQAKSPACPSHDWVSEMRTEKKRKWPLLEYQSAHHPRKPTSAHPVQNRCRWRWGYRLHPFHERSIGCQHWRLQPCCCSVVDVGMITAVGMSRLEKVGEARAGKPV